MTKPNILFLLVDCLRADAIFGEARKTITPTFDRLANEACCFSDVISVNSLTVPCMASYFTGLYPFNHGLRSLRQGKLRGDIPTLAGLLALNGYHTYAESAGPMGEESGLLRGFQEAAWREGTTETLSSEWGERFRQRLRPGGLEAPWFMYCHIWELHTPRQVAPGYRSEEFGTDLYERAVSSFDSLLAGILEAVGDDTIVVVTSDHGEIGESADPRAWMQGLVRYRRLVKSLLPGWLAGPVERAATKLKTGLMFSGKVSQEIKGSVRRIVVTGHGHHIVDPLIRVPLILFGPTGLPEGKMFDRVVSQVDVAPTLLELVGMPEALCRCDGMSLVPFARGREMPPRGVYFENAGRNDGLSREEQMESPWMVGLRSDRYKFWYRRFNPRQFPELYDIVADPRERDNLVEAMPEVAAEMQRKIEALAPQDVEGPFSDAEEFTSEEAKLVEERLRGLGYIE